MCATAASLQVTLRGESHYEFPDVSSSSPFLASEISAESHAFVRRALHYASAVQRSQINFPPRFSTTKSIQFVEWHHLSTSARDYKHGARS